MQQQHATDCSCAGQFEAVVPVDGSVFRVCCTTGTVTFQLMRGPTGGLGVNFIVQLFEQPVFQRKVVIEVADPIVFHHVGGKLFGELFRVPGFQGWAAAGLQAEHQHSKYRACDATY